MFELILVRHGQSEWNKRKLFTGWHDAPLSDQGREEAIAAGKRVKSLGLDLTFAYTSMLQRAIGTLWLMLKHSEKMNIPVSKHWELNERHYGDLQGHNKDEMRKIHGDEQVHLWRRDYKTRPPESKEVKSVPSMYRNLSEYPKCESLYDTYLRVSNFWDNEISHKIKSGEKVIITAHGNSLRALIKHIEGIADDDIVHLEIPTGKPIKITFDENLKFKERVYL